MYPYEFHFYKVKNKCNRPTQPEFLHSYTDLKNATILKYVFTKCSNFCIYVYFVQLVGNENVNVSKEHCVLCLRHWLERKR